MTSTHCHVFYLYASLLLTWATGIHGVSITAVKTNTSATSHDPFVILPCNFTTNSLEAPRITWFRYRGEERVRILRFENNRLFSYQELSDRVARGDKGALVLIRPSVKDTGRYSCEVEVERERPGWVKTDLYLNVTRPKVTVTTTRKPVRAGDTDVFVTLPCDYRTNDPTLPRIAWHLVKGSKDTQDIAVFNKDGGLSVSDQFVGRVARGNRGDLVLIAPRVEDTGTYKCAIQVDNGDAVTADVKLSVSRNVKYCNPGQSSGVEVFICILWIIPVFCGFVVEEKRFARIIHIFRTVTSPKQLVIKGWRYILIIIALCLIFSGTAYSARALSSGDPTDFSTYRGIAYGTGILGIVIIICVYLCVYLTKMRRKTELSVIESPKTHTVEAENIAGNDPENETFHDCASGFDNSKLDSSKSVDIREGQRPLLLTEEGSAVSEKESNKTNVQVLKGPTSDEITGMVSVSSTDLYVTTPSALHHLDTSALSDRVTYSKRVERPETLAAVCHHKDGVFLLGKSKSKFVVISVRLKPDINAEIVQRMENSISWICTDRDRGCIYFIYPGRHEVVKDFLDENLQLGKYSQTINTCEGLLMSPSCIVKNSKEELIVTDSGRNDVLVFNEKSGFVTSMKISVPKELETELRGCNRLAIDKDDKIYVSGPNSKHVCVFGADFRFERAIPTDSQPREVISCLMIHDNSLYVAHGDCIRIHPLGQTDTALYDDFS